MTKYYDIIRKPIITEQSMKMVENENRYTFEVSKGTNKIEIKKAIEEIFEVTVLNVKTVNMLPKFKRVGRHEGLKPGYKKAIVQLAVGDKIDIFTS